MGGRGNFDSSVDTLGVDRDRRAEKYSEKEQAPQSVLRRSNAFIFKGNSQGSAQV